MKISSKFKCNLHKADSTKFPCDFLQCEQLDAALLNVRQQLKEQQMMQWRSESGVVQSASL